MAALELFNTSFYTDADLVSYYRMEGNGNDSKGGNTLSNSGGTFSTGNGKFNQGCGFTGSATSWLTIASFTGMPTGLNPKTTCLWFSPKSQPGTNVEYSIFGYWGAEGNRMWDIRYVDISGTKYLAPYWGNQAGQWINISYTCNTGIFYHLALVYDGTTVIMYANGIEIGRQVTGIGTLANGKLAIGAHAQSNIYGGWGNVNVDEWALFKRVLTPGEINYLYRGTEGAFIYNML